MKIVLFLVTLAVATLFLVNLCAQIPDYNRDDWPHWIDADGDGQDTRQEVLIAESLTPVATNRNATRVLSGEWLDKFTGEVYTDPSDLDIDHLLSLRWVYDRGGFEWDEAQREAYANELNDPDHLVAVGSSVNRSKGARGPADWRPPDEGSWCWYGATVVRLSFQWLLVLTAADRSGLGELLAACEVE